MPHAYEAWLATTQNGQLDQGNLVHEVMETEVWDGWTAAKQTALGAAIATATATKAKMGDKTHKTALDAKANQLAFKALVALLRYFDNNCLQSPPRTEAELAKVGKKLKKKAEEIGVPTALLIGSTIPFANGILQVLLKILGTLNIGREAENYVFCLHVGIVDKDAAPDAIGRYGHYLATDPTNALGLGFVIITHLLKFEVNFDEQDRGKKVWFCATVRNEKGDEGRFGPMFWAIIP
jgi:hypothetical protein